MISGQSYYKRIGYVAIESADGRMIEYGGKDGLDFKFSGEKYGSIYVNFTVSILGLNASTINDLTVWNIADAMAESRKIEVYAGYEKGGISNPLFKGIIIEAIPTNPPEMWLNFKCMNIEQQDEVRIVKPRIYEGYIDRLFIKMANELGLIGRWNSDRHQPSEIVKFGYSGSKSEICKKFADTFGVVVYEEDGTLYAVDEHGQMGNTDELPDGSILDININNGLLGLTNVTLVGADIKMRLNDKCKLMSWVNLTSTLMPKASGMYYVIKKKHVGHFRGEEWYTELQTLRKGAIA